MQEEELFRIGTIADVQYGDFDDGSSEGRCQAFREVPAKLELILKCMQENNVSMIITVGDIIEGHKPQSLDDQFDLKVITDIFNTSHCPVSHTLGNHDVCLDRDYMTKQLEMPACYYSRQLAPGWKLLVLDTTDLSTGTEFKPCWPIGSQQHAAAKAYLDAHPQDNGDNVHMFAWNGGVGEEQMRWLRGELSASEQANERVIVSSHHPLGLGSARRTHMAWNFQEVQDVCVRSKACVLAIAGHDHLGGYTCYGHTHFMTQPALVEAPSGSNAFAILKIFVDRIEVDGQDSTVPSRTLSFND